MWLKASGHSLWPLLLDGDSLRVLRLDADSLRPGDVAIVKLPHGILAAHLVISIHPLQTSSSAGIVDAQPIEGLGRVTGFRRGGTEWPWPSSNRLWLRWLPTAARVLKRGPLVRPLVRLLRTLK